MKSPGQRDRAKFMSPSNSPIQAEYLAGASGRAPGPSRVAELSRERCELEQTECIRLGLSWPEVFCHRPRWTLAHGLRRISNKARRGRRNKSPSQRGPGLSSTTCRVSTEVLTSRPNAQWESNGD